MIAVKTAPAKIPSRGLENRVIRLINAWESRRGVMAVLIISIPMNSTPRPAMIRPTVEFNVFKKYNQNHAGKSDQGASAPTSSAIRRPVTVVPILAPMMIQAAWVRVIIRELTNPTTITVVAEED